MLESIANRLCSLQCDMLCMGGGFDVETVGFKFMVWNHTAHNVKMGYVDDGVRSLFVVRYESPVHGRRLFVGAPWLIDCEDRRSLASSDAIDRFLQQVKRINSLQADIVFDGSLAVDKPLSLHLRLGGPIDGKTLLVRDVVVCGNVLIAIDLFE